METPTKSPSANAGSGTKEILMKVDAMVAEIKFIKETNSIFQADVITKLDQLIVKANQAPVKAARAPSTKTAANGAPVKTKPTNSMYWFRASWKSDREDMVTKYCTADMMKKLEKHMSSDDNKDKVDDGRLDAEQKFIWTTYCAAKVTDSTLRDRIKKDYENFCVEFDKQNQTAVTKDEAE